MKKHFYTSFVFISFTLFSISCNKAKTAQTTAEMVVGKWQVQSEIYHENVAGFNFSDTTLGMGNTFEFRNDGKLYSSFLGQEDTSIYKIIGDSTLAIVNFTTYNIEALTSNQFVLYSKETDSSGVHEQTINLVK